MAGWLQQLEFRSAQVYSGGHSDDVDYVSWNPTHPELFCTSSQKDRRIVFWDARRGLLYRLSYTFSLLSPLSQKVVLSNNALWKSRLHTPSTLQMDGRFYSSRPLINWCSWLMVRRLKKRKNNGKPKFCQIKKIQFVRFYARRSVLYWYNTQVGSKAIFNHSGDGLVVAFHSEHTLRVIDYPSLEVKDSPAAHVGGCMALALDPRGR